MHDDLLQGRTLQRPLSEEREHIFSAIFLSQKQAAEGQVTSDLDRASIMERNNRKVMHLTD